MINVRDLTYRYPGNDSDTLRTLSLCIRPGEITAIMGANGSGKTTFIRCLNGLIRPDSGSVMVDEFDVLDSANLFQVRKKVGMVFQSPDNQIVATTVEREIAFGLENLGLEAGRMRKKVKQTLERFSLSEYRHSAPHLLSGGERQRLALASICVMEPDYLVLDEPTSLLDPKGKKEIFEYILHHRDAGMGIILVTQSAEEAMLCDRLAVLHHGQVVSDGKPEQVFFQVDKIRPYGIQIPAAVELDVMVREIQHAH